MIRCMFVQRNGAPASNPKGNNQGNRIRTQDEEGIPKNLQEHSISWIGRMTKLFWCVDGMDVVGFYPLVETFGSCRIPSPPPDPTGSCHHLVLRFVALCRHHQRHARLASCI